MTPEPDVQDPEAEQDKVDRWLASTGFPLEYAAVKTLEGIGYLAEGAVYYQPRDGGAPREVDVVARTQGPWDDPPIAVRLVLECKVATSPWVVLTRDATVPAAALLESIVATNRAKKKLRPVRGRPFHGLPKWLWGDQHGAVQPRVEDVCQRRPIPTLGIGGNIATSVCIR